MSDNMDMPEDRDSLSLKEAYEALFRGEMVKDRDGSAYRYDPVSDRFNIKYFGEDAAESIWCYSGPRGEFAPFTLYKPEPKSLTFEEAYRALSASEELRVDTPLESMLVNCNMAAYYVLPFLDLAERRGWTITQRGNK
jgi:hypothetical protein